MSKLTFYLPLLLIMASATTMQAQNSVEQPDNLKNEIVSIGLGFGFDYSLFGAGILVYPQKNIGFFANGGICFAGPSYTIGLKGRYITNSKVDPYISLQYGYSGCVYIIDDDDKDKIFIKPNIGAGLDIHFTSKLALTAGITTNIAASEIRDYMDELEENNDADFGNQIVLPFAISCSIKWRIK